MDLIDKLREIVGERVSAAPTERLCYSSDASQVKGMPDCVVRPLTTEEVSKVVALASDLGVAITARGAGTGLAERGDGRDRPLGPRLSRPEPVASRRPQPVRSAAEEERPADPARLLSAQRPRGEGVRGSLPEREPVIRLLGQKATRERPKIRVQLVDDRDARRDLDLGYPVV